MTQRNLKAKALAVAGSLLATAAFFGLAATDSAGASTATPVPVQQIAPRLVKRATPVSNFTPPPSAPRAHTRTRAS